MAQFFILALTATYLRLFFDYFLFNGGFVLFASRYFFIGNRYYVVNDSAEFHLKYSYAFRQILKQGLIRSDNREQFQHHAFGRIETAALFDKFNFFTDIDQIALILFIKLKICRAFLRRLIRIRIAQLL